MLKPLKYISYAIVFQEVHNEISLVFNISGCPHHCIGCHSQYLWEYEGDNLLENMENIINQYNNYITCVCFMGGDQNMYDLGLALKQCKKMGYKTCVYSGLDCIQYFESLIPLLDWVKTGRYDESLKCDNHIEYGVKLATSNQHLYKVEDYIMSR